MLGTYFYHKTIRKMVVLFGTIFNDIWVKRTNSNDVVVEQMKVPVSYGSKGKFLTRLKQDPTLTKQTAITTPRIGFEITAVTYDPVRKLNTLGTNLKKGTNSGTLKKQYNPVPYNFDVGCYSINLDCTTGNPENDDYNLRGKMFSNESGHYAFETILPGYYANRPKHIHIKITTPNEEVLISQIYFEGDPLCETDSWCQDAEDRILVLQEDNL